MPMSCDHRRLPNAPGFCRSARRPTSPCHLAGKAPETVLRSLPCRSSFCHSIPSLPREPLHGEGCAPLQSSDAHILENWTGYAARPPRHRASTCTSGETGRMLSSRSVRPLTTRGISLRSIPMSRSRRSSMPRRVSIIFRRCHWRNVVRSQRRNAPGLQLRGSAARGGGK